LERPLDQQRVPQTYHEILQDELGVKKPTTLHGLEDVLQQRHYIEIAEAKATVAG